MSTTASTSDDTIGTVEEEIETLKAIYIKELEVDYDDRSEFPTRVTLNLHPATADNADEQYVRLTLVIDIPSNYPNNLPMFYIRKSRGLSDEDLQRIYDDLHRKADGCRGSPMLYELIELAKEHLTTGNTPRCSCTICLYGFCEDDAFIKTDCYHYFHSHCLRRYVECSTEVVQNEDDKKCQISCPVCREPITYSSHELESLPPPTNSDCVVDFVPDSTLLVLQRKMAALFVHQKSRGGIIDVEAERNKYLLEISAVPNELTPATKFKRAGPPLLNGDHSSRPKSSEAPKWNKGKSTSAKRNWNPSTDSRYDIVRGSSSCSHANKGAGGPPETRVRAANDSSHEYVAREGRRAPRRGSHHGSRGGRSQGGQPKNVVNASQSASDCNGHVTDRLHANSRDNPCPSTTTTTSSRVNSLKCRASEQSSVNDISQVKRKSATDFRTSAQKNSADRQNFRRPVVAATAAASTASSYLGSSEQYEC